MVLDMEFNIKKKQVSLFKNQDISSKSRVSRFINYRRPSNYAGSLDNADPNEELKALQIPKLTMSLTLIGSPALGEVKLRPLLYSFPQ